MKHLLQEVHTKIDITQCGRGTLILLCRILFSRSPQKILIDFCAYKGGHKACVTTFESNFVGRSTENTWQSKIKAPITTKEHSV